MVVNLPRGKQVQVVGRPQVIPARRQAGQAQKAAEAFSSNGDNITNGTIDPTVLPIATTTTPGIVQPDGVTIDVDVNGVIDVPIATVPAVGVVKPDGSSVTIDPDGTIHATPTAGTLELTDGTHDVLAVTKITVTGGTVGGSTPNATLTISSSGGTVTTTGSPASGNLTKFSGATSITNGDLSGDVTTSGTLATTIGNKKVTYAKIQDETDNTLLGRSAGSAGAPMEIAVGTGLSLSGGTLTSTGTGGTVTTTGSPASGNLTKFSGSTSITNGDLSGDVTTSGTLATTLANTAVTPASYGDATHVGSFTVDSKGRLTAASNVAITVPTGANPTGTGSDTATNGTSPNFLRSDATFAIQKTSSSVFGLAKVDNTTITASGGVISATGFVPLAAAFHPGYVSGLFYTGPRLTIQNTSAGVNTLHAIPLYIGVTQTFTKASMNVVSGATAATEVTLGLYANNSGVPGALLQTFGHLPTTGTGTGELTGLTIALTPGWYWLAIVGNSATPQLTGGSGTTTLLDFLCGTSSLATLGGGYTGSFTYSSGVLPNPFPSPTLSTNSTQPYVFLRF